MNMKILIPTFLALLIIAWLLYQREESSRHPDIPKTIATIDSAAVKEIHVRTVGEEIVMKKVDGQWRLQEPIDWPANEDRLKDFIRDAGKIELENLISDNVEKQKKYQVDSTGVWIYIDDGSVHEFVIGKGTQDYASTFVREKSSTNVYLANGYLTTQFQRPVDEWRNKTVYSVARESIEEISVQQEKGNYTLTRNRDEWTVNFNGSEKPAKAPMIDNVLNLISEVKGDNFPDTNLTKGIDWTNAKAKILVSAGADSKTLLFYREKPDHYEFYLKREDKPTVYSVYASQFDPLLQEPEKFVEEPKPSDTTATAGSQP